MIRKPLALAVLCIALLATASATVTETTFNRNSQNTALATTTILTVGGSFNGNYHLDLSLSGNAGAQACSSIQAVVRWTDEYGNAGAASVNIGTAVSPSGNSSNVIRVAAGSAITVQVLFSPDCTQGGTNLYSLSVDLLGYW